MVAVDIEEIKRLGKRFKKLDLDKSGSLSVDEFMSLPELQQNPLVQRVIDIFDTDGNGEVDFKGEWAFDIDSNISPRIIRSFLWSGMHLIGMIKSHSILKVHGHGHTHSCNLCRFILHI